VIGDELEVLKADGLIWGDLDAKQVDVTDDDGGFT
jgi:hypothetical protein